MNFDNPPTYGKYMDLKSYDIHAITGVVKKYLRQLPDPAIPIVCHEDFIQLYGKEERSKQKRELAHFLTLSTIRSSILEKVNYQYAGVNDPTTTKRTLSSNSLYHHHGFIHTKACRNQHDES